MTKTVKHDNMKDIKDVDELTEKRLEEIKNNMTECKLVKKTMITF